MKKLLSGLLFVTLFALFVLPVLARAQTATPGASRRLTNGKLTACKAREAAIKNRMDSLAKLAKTMEDKFDSIASRVETFYANKVVPGGKTVSNYDALVAAIATKRDAVATALNKTQADVTAFSCTVDNPKSLYTTFRLDMMATKSALRDYRTAIKNLIVAVHSVAPTESPRPSRSPEAK